jgi:hypothetical protein
MRMGIEDSINIADDRTIQIIKDYQFYKYAPHKINNNAWKEAVTILNQLQPRLF